MTEKQLGPVAATASETLVKGDLTWTTVTGTAADGVTDDKAALASSDDAALTAELPLMLTPGTYFVDSNLTIDSPVWFTPGSVLKPDNGVTVTLAGGVVNAPMSQMFDTSAGGTVVLAKTISVYPQWWGAVGDGVTVDTDALQAWANYIVANQAEGALPKGEYLIDETLVFPSGYGWKLVGQSWTDSIIRQDTDNVPVVQIGTPEGGPSSRYVFSHVFLDYSEAQPAENTNAYNLKFSGDEISGTWGAQFSNIRFNNGYYAMMSIPGIFAPWGSEFHALQTGRNMSGGFLTHTGSMGAPSNVWGRITVYCNEMVGPVFNDWGDTSTSVEAIELLEAYQGARLIEASGSWFNVDVGTIKLEQGDYSDGGVIFNILGAHQVRIGDLRVYGNDLTIGDGTTMLRAGWGTTDSRSWCEIGTMKLEASSLTGNAYALHVPATGGRASVGSVIMADGWKLSDNGSTATGEQLTIRSMVNGRVKNVGDANYTVPVACIPSPNIIRFQTALTENRTVTLPDNFGTDVFGGLYYEIIVGANVLANYSLTIAVTNRSNLRVLAAGTTAALKLRYVHRHTEWILTDFAELGTPQTGYAVTNVTPDRILDANSTSTDELADVLGTLINDLKAKGIIAS